MWSAARHAAARTARVSAINKLLQGLEARVQASTPALGRQFGRRTFILSTPRLATRAATAGKATATKAKGGAATATKRKTTTKKAAAKPRKAKAAAAKKKPAPKKPVKKRVAKVLTDEQKQNLQARELRKASLIKEQPTELPTSSWTVFSGQRLKNTKTEGGVTVAMTQLSQEYKGLRDSELEALKTTGHQNFLANQAALKNWIESHPVDEIIKANNARLLLKRLKKTTRPTLHDDRIPKRPVSPFLLFTKSRWQSGELSGQAGEVQKQVASEWKALSAAERQTYEDAAAPDKERYIQQVKSVLGRDIRKSASPGA